MDGHLPPRETLDRAVKRSQDEPTPQRARRSPQESTIRPAFWSGYRQTSSEAQAASGSSYVLVLTARLRPSNTPKPRLQDRQ